MAAIGPVSLEEARDVLADRLRTLDDRPAAPPLRRASSSAARSRRAAARSGSSSSPGLAERMFPQKPREDPMLLDEEMREPLDAGLPTQDDRAQTERLLLRLAVGAATERLWLSYPRIDVAGVAAARAVVLRARHHARDYRAHPATTRRSSAARSWKGARSSPGRRRRVRLTPSTTSSTISRRCAS